MNRYFHDARYYLRRTVESAAQGVRTELAPVLERVPYGDDEEPDRWDDVREQVREYETDVAGRAEGALDRAKETMSGYRQRRTA